MVSKWHVSSRFPRYVSLVNASSRRAIVRRARKFLKEFWDAILRRIRSSPSSWLSGIMSADNLLLLLQRSSLGGRSLLYALIRYRRVATLLTCSFFSSLLGVPIILFSAILLSLIVYKGASRYHDAKESKASRVPLLLIFWRDGARVSFDFASSD